MLKRVICPHCGKVTASSLKNCPNCGGLLAGNPPVLYQTRLNAFLCGGRKLVCPNCGEVRVEFRQHAQDSEKKQGLNNLANTSCLLGICCFWLFLPVALLFSVAASNQKRHQFGSGYFCPDCNAFMYFPGPDHIGPPPVNTMKAVPHYRPFVPLSSPDSLGDKLFLTFSGLAILGAMAAAMVALTSK